ncbi:aminotransferase-like domain-containing protein [Neoroseomonas oryzicola]|uniref:PLP-dependent aminotransferase family protein n=1 Tax=Neoroseomonas oryzicola TaxID=535904 RepID=A0A9X9WL53_9PROT|nr:PLP-dependent aminotransferase family protein [Neoroseomonas oryzicola]MBR0661063.1 PLP-dependent aminotransferase family protein [Neoroseomonas oryzicola]NKE18288.1 PLP-dependent aminotransferase family protein [Neoroseomonas oryzicola]
MAREDRWIGRVAGHEGPIYRAIADAIGAAVAAGELREGDRLPTHRALAEALGVDLTTVTRAYAEARSRGLLQATVGRGSFIRAARAPGGGDSAVDLSMNLPPQPDAPALPALLRDGMAALLGGPGATEVLTYRSGAGSLAERAAGAAWLRPVLGEVPVERVLLSPGAQPALMVVLGAVMAPGEVLLTDAMTYPGLRGAAAQLGLRLRGVAADAEGMLPEAIEAACRAEPRPKALYCVPTMHNPTAATMPLARREAIAALARRQGLQVIEDDAYGLLPSAPLPAIASLAPECCFHVATVSKVISPALRVAWLVVPDVRWAARMASALRATVLMASPLLAGVFARWVEDGTAARVLGAIRHECAARQRIAREVLAGARFAAHPEGIHLWLDLPGGWDRLDFAAHLRRRGLAVVPSDAFAVEAPAPAVRVSLGAAADRTALRGALGAIADALRSDAPSSFSDIV